MESIQHLGLKGVKGSRINDVTVSFDLFQPNDLSNLTGSEWLNISAPYLEDSGEFDRCRIFDVSYTVGSSRSVLSLHILTANIVET